MYLMKLMIIYFIFSLCLFSCHTKANTSTFFNNTNLNKETSSYISAIMCNEKGIWQNKTSQCSCSENWVTYPRDSSYGCNYELRSQAVSLFLSFFLGPLGFDMFYLGYNFRGLIKCLLPLSSLIIILSIHKRQSIKTLSFAYYFILLPIMILLFMWTLDFVLIIFFPYDSHGYPLT